MILEDASLVETRKEEKHKETGRRKERKKGGDRKDKGTMIDE